MLFHAAPDSQGSKRPVVFFVHHFGGNQTSPWRHVKIFNSLGFDCVTFTLSSQRLHLSALLDARVLLKRGVRHVWEEDILNVVNGFDEKGGGRQKIMFSFSGPGASAIAAMATLFKKGDHSFRAYICDSGPFDDVLLCTDNLLREVYGFQNFLTRKLALGVSAVTWGRHHSRDLKENLKTIIEKEPGFPVLSFRSMKDSLVPPSTIEKVFRDRGINNLTVIELNETGHLNGLKTQPAFYEKSLVAFLKQHALLS